MFTLIKRATRTLEDDPALVALSTSASCFCASLVWMIATMYFNNVLEHSMLRGRSYADAVVWSQIMFGIEFVLISTAIYYFVRAIRIAGSTEQ